MATLPHIILHNAQHAPDQLALVLQESGKPDKPFTYHHLLFHSLNFSRALEKAGIAPDDVVIIVLQHSPELIFSFLGSILLGAIPSIMPFLTEKLSPEHYRKSLRALFHVIQPAAVITYPEFASEIQLACQDTSVRAILITDQIPSSGLTSEEEHPALQRDESSIVLLQHSSGTTGLQKGVALSHRAVLNQLNSYKSAIQLSSDDVVVSWLPLYHDMGLIAGFLMPLLLQVPLILMSPFDWVRSPIRLFQAISAYNGTLTWLPNFAYNFCAQKIRENDLKEINLSSLRAVINCSEPMVYQSHQMFLNRFRSIGLRESALATCYAMAENVFAVSQDGIQKPVTLDWVSRSHLATRQIAQPASPSDTSICMVSAGRPISNTSVKILDPHGNALPERHVGEIAIQSDCMLTGYYKRPDLTSSAFLDGWYLTGDLGYITNGELYITGRKKDLIIVGGKNIYPQDIEQIASTVEGVYPGRVVAFGVFNELTGTEDVVVIAESEETSPEKRQSMAEKIRLQVNRASDITLRKAMIVDRGWLLKTSSGKIARNANREKFLTSFNP
jgi:acyl-CoA synthetase (AMP-forming)/AMP-acid ligase II